MQLGSPTLGRVNDDDVEKGLVFPDVFKHTHLDTLKPKEISEDDDSKPKSGKRAR